MNTSEATLNLLLTHLTTLWCECKRLAHVQSLQYTSVQVHHILQEKKMSFRLLLTEGRTHSDITSSLTLSSFTLQSDSTLSAHVGCWAGRQANACWRASALTLSHNFLGSISFKSSLDLTCSRTSSRFTELFLIVFSKMLRMADNWCSVVLADTGISLSSAVMLCTSPFVNCTASSTVTGSCMFTLSSIQRSFSSDKLSIWSS